jgi:hypothetical protein
VARDDTATTSQDVPLIIDVLANDTDADGNLLAPVLATPPAHGTAALAPDNSFTYTPQGGFYGTDSFTYRARDGSVESSAATVSITVNRQNNVPAAIDDSVTTDEDAPATVNVLANDSDPDNDSLTVSVVTQAAHGLVINNADGTVTYTPDGNFNGPDAFSYTISDGYGGADTATVNVTVLPVNDSPVARDDAATTDAGTPVTIDVVSNDTDPDGDSCGVASVTHGGHGAVIVNADGTVTYTPEADYSGTDNFTYTVTDGNGGTDTATVAVSVGAVPYEEDFDNGPIENPDVRLGNWRTAPDPSASYPGDQCLVGEAVGGGNAIFAGGFDLAGSSSVDIQVTFNAEDIIPGSRWSNAFVIFDYQSPTDFKFAGAFVGLDQWVIGRSASNANGYVVDRVFSERIDALTDYAVQVLIEGSSVTLQVHDGQHYGHKVSHTYSDPRDSLQDGSVGVGTMKGITRFDDLHVESTDRVFGELGGAP